MGRPLRLPVPSRGRRCAICRIRCWVFERFTILSVTHTHRHTHPRRLVGCTRPPRLLRPCPSVRSFMGRALSRTSASVVCRSGCVRGSARPPAVVSRQWHEGFWRPLQSRPLVRLGWHPAAYNFWFPLSGVKWARPDRAFWSVAALHPVPVAYNFSVPWNGEIIRYPLFPAPVASVRPPRAQGSPEPIPEPGGPGLR